MSETKTLLSLVQAFFQDYLAGQRGLSPNTILAYRDALKGVPQVSEPKRTLSNKVFVISEILAASERTEFAFENGIGDVKMVASEYIEVLVSEG